jgi:hypothetical protein
MAKNRRHQPEPPASSRTTMLILAIGGLVVAALVVWALTRTVETPAPSVADTSATATPLTSTTAPLTATQPPAPFPAAAPAGETTAMVPRIAAEDLREKWKTKAVTVIDVRDAGSFAAGHIPGALHIPLASIETEMSSLPKNKPIVTYCT